MRALLLLALVLTAFGLAFTGIPNLLYTVIFSGISFAGFGVLFADTKRIRS